MFEAMPMDSSSALHYSRSIPRQVVESRVESVLCQEDGRVALVEKAYYYLAGKGNQLTIHEKRQAQHSIENLSIIVVGPLRWFVTWRQV